MQDFGSAPHSFEGVDGLDFECSKESCVLVDFDGRGTVAR